MRPWPHDCRCLNLESNRCISLSKVLYMWLKLDLRKEVFVARKRLFFKPAFVIQMLITIWLDDISLIIGSFNNEWTREAELFYVQMEIKIWGDWSPIEQTWSFCPIEISPLGIAKWTLPKKLFWVQLDSSMDTLFLFSINLLIYFSIRAICKHVHSKSG